ncbi:early endosome antigen 1-like isoform X3 [Drosophila novamexicana]|uniref:early endosome antigen 1-like isoform X3 n=1 Tax=Drosophila novamexicana TaxID=47314 RepID=UPI0011E5FB26|nr:early endosome antigen 1-like isoform X3 [Drosophila novamexicana]
MELSIWKYVLLQWVQKCNFIENITCIEDSDIEAFFTFYAQHAQVKLPASSSSRTFPMGQLKTFLGDIYPNFKPRLELDGRVVTADFIYVYTLLMHYTCVQRPSEYFHNICKNLPDNIQQCIAAFFQQTIQNPEMTRIRLHETIINIRYITENNFSVNSSSCSPLSHMSVHNISDGNSYLLNSNKDSPSFDNDVSASTSTSPVTSGPMKRELISLLDRSQWVTPPTPKTELLEQRTRELLGLRAQLETERYEKTVLEEQILENQIEINSLSKENLAHKKQLAKFSATLQSEHDNEDNYLHSNELDSLKRQLLKDLSIKDAILAENNEEIYELKSKLVKVSSKLKVSEKHVLVCMDRINDLEQRLENATQVLTEKDDDIACLQRDRLELEQCLQETRAELHNGREVLNASSDLLETSHSTCSLNTTPENLGCSVVDKQLREKAQENDELRKQLAVIVEEKSNMLRKLLRIVQPHSLEMSSATEDSQLMCLIGHSMDQLSVRYEQELQRVKELQVQYNTLKQQNMQCEECIQEQIRNKKRLDRILGQSQLTLLATIEKLQQRDNEYGQSVNISQELEKKDEQLARVGSELIQLCSQKRILEGHISEEKECSFSQRQKLKAQQMIIQSQQDQLAEQRQRLNDAQQQVQCLIHRISAKCDHDTTSSPTSENRLKQVENMLICLMDRMRNQDKRNKCENQLSEHSPSQVSSQLTIMSTEKLYDEEHNAAKTNQSLKLETEETTIQNGGQTQLSQQLEVGRQELCKQKQEAHVKQQLKAVNENQKRLEHRLKEQTELLQKRESTSQALQEQIMIQTQQLEKGQRELNDSQRKLKEAQQQLHKQESLILHVNKLENWIKEERRKNLSLEQEQIQQMEHKRIIEKEFKAIQCTLAKREEELEKSKSQLDLSTKRLEKIAIKQGEQQAILSKTQREKAQSKRTQNEQAELITVLQREKESLLLELRKNKERTSRSEEKQASLEQQRVLAETARVATYERMIKLERECKKTNINTIRDLQLQLKDVEKEKDRLFLEVGGLNLEIVQQQRRTADLSAQLQQANEHIDAMRTSMQVKENNACNAQQLELIERAYMQQLADARQELKDQRLDMEGKLEKMKTKMRTLCTAEMNRIKEKHERDVATNKVELEKLTVQKPSKFIMI